MVRTTHGRCGRKFDVYIYARSVWIPMSWFYVMTSLCMDHDQGLPIRHESSGVRQSPRIRHVLPRLLNLKRASKPQLSTPPPRCSPLGSTGGSRGKPAMPPKAQKGVPSCLLPPPPKLPKIFCFYVFFFESEFGSIPKNSGLNPWSIQF